MASEVGPAVEVSGLVKRYPRDSANAVDSMEFAVAQGEVFGLLGPNGAGKSTTIGILTTQVRKTAGTARVVGIDVAAEPVRARSRLSVVPQRSNFDQALSARENLLFHAAYHGVHWKERRRRADELLEQFGLFEDRDKKAAKFSGGMQQRLLIARALMHRPQVLFLDEPSTGLDPQARLFVWDRIRDLRATGITVMLTTHDMDEAAELADRVGIVDHGKVLALDTPVALTKSLAGRATLDLGIQHTEVHGTDLVLKALGEIEGVEGVECLSSGAEPSAPLRARLYVAGAAADMLGPVTAVLKDWNSELAAAELGTPTLEDVFINMTGRDLR